MTDKIKTMVHFAIKSRRIVIGADSLIAESRKHCKIVFADAQLADNALERIKRYCEERRILLVRTDFIETLGVPIRGCKVLGMTDSHMCKGLREEIENNMNYSIILGGSNLG